MIKPGGAGLCGTVPKPRMDARSKNQQLLSPQQTLPKSRACMRGFRQGSVANLPISIQRWHFRKTKHIIEESMRFTAFILALSYPALTAHAAARPIEFNRYVRPILPDKCTVCHAAVAASNQYSHR